MFRGNRNELGHIFFSIMMCVLLLSLSVAKGEVLSKAELFPPVQSNIGAGQTAIQSLSLSLNEPQIGLMQSSSSGPGVTLITNSQGQFTLQRASDGKWLLYPNAETSYMSVNIDGSVYTNQQNGGLTVASQIGNIWVYNPVNGVQITQTLTIEGDALKCTVEAKNISGQNHSVQIRYLFDTQVDDNDGAPLYSAGNHYTHEVQFVPPMFSEWRSWRRPDDQSTIGVGTLETSLQFTTTKIVFAHWPVAFRQNWDYTANPEEIFYTPGYISSPESDSCVLIYMDFGTVFPGLPKTAHTWYGIGTPGGVNNRFDPIIQAIHNLRSSTSSKLESDEFGLAIIFAYAYKASYEDSVVNDAIKSFFGDLENPIDDMTLSMDITRMLATGAVDPEDFVTKGIGLVLKEWIKSLDEETRNAFANFWNELIDDPSLNPNDDIYSLAISIKAKLDTAKPFLYHDEWVISEHKLILLEDFVASQNDNASLRDDVISQTAENLYRIASDLEQAKVQRVVIKWYSLQNNTFNFIENGSVSSSIEPISSIYADMQSGEAQYANINSYFQGASFVSSGLLLGKVLLGVSTGGSLFLIEGAVALAITTGGITVDLSATGNDVKLSGTIMSMALQNSEFARQEIKTVEQIGYDSDNYVRSLFADSSSFAFSKVDITQIEMPSIVLADNSSVGTVEGQVKFNVMGPDRAKTKIYVEMSAYTSNGRNLVTVANPEVVNNDLLPGDHRYSFDYSAIAPEEIGAQCTNYTGKVWVSYGTALVSSDIVSFAVGSAAACRIAQSNTYSNVAASTIQAGSNYTTSYQVPPQTERVELVLDYPGSDLDLHVYDPQGRHIGVDYGTGAVEIGVPDSNYSGSSTVPEVIVLHNPMEGNYIVRVTGVVVENGEEPFRVDSLITPSNRPPDANAGPDQTAYAWIDGIAEVNLDGSGSYDDDNDLLTYKWSWTIDGNNYGATDVKPTIELPVGQHVISLIVNDGLTDSEPNEVNITVIGPIEANLCVTPKVLNCKSFMPKILATLRLPKGITKDQIDSNEPILLFPGEIEADWTWISRDFDYKCRAWNTTIFSSFDKDKLMDAIDDTGQVELVVVGQLKTGQYFFGTDNIRVISPGHWPWHRPWCDYRWNRWCHRPGNCRH